MNNKGRDKMNYHSNALETVQWSLEIDLKKDLESFMEKQMRKMNIPPSGTRSIMYEYFNTQKRVIFETPRKVVYSREFQCPEEYQEALSQFEQSAREGKNLNTYLSDQIRKPEKSDDLLNDWNIYHFHLTKRFREDGFAKRSDYQIFAWVTADCIYMIQIYPHKEAHLYTKKELLKIIEENWPELLKPHHIQGAVRLSVQLDDEQYGVLRDAHATSFVELGENKVYGLIGGGYMSDGSSGEAVRREQFWHNRLKICEMVIRGNMPFISSVVRRQRGLEPPVYRFQLLWISNFADSLRLIEWNSHMGVEWFPEKGKLRIFTMEEELDFGGAFEGGIRLL